MVFDFETTGLVPGEAEVIQVAGKAYRADTLEPYPVDAGGEFSSMMRPVRVDNLDDPGVRKALSVNKKTKEDILAAPDQKLVWNEFVAWVNKFNTTRNFMGAPIAGGKNIRDFDLKFVDVLNRLHCKNKEKTLLFNRRQQVDLEDFIFAWFEHDPELPNMKMDTLREYFGMSGEGAHDALVDVRQTGELLVKFLKLKRDLRKRLARDGSPLIKFRDSCRARAA